ncbi:MAG: DUF2935 domain-containing protein [Candidatus Saccharibacteria bacterium]
MKDPDYGESALFEQRFWLQVLDDHSRFIHNSLGPAEKPACDPARPRLQIKYR